MPRTTQTRPSPSTRPSRRSGGWGRRERSRTASSSSRRTRRRSLPARRSSSTAAAPQPAKPSETEEQMAVYIEYISRRPGVPLEAFHAIAGPGQTAWSAEHSDDRLILNIGRTWRLGSEPEYIAVWHTPDKGANRLGEWAAIFASGEADHLELPFTAVGRIDVAGFYEPLLEPVTGSRPVYYGEVFDVASRASPEDVVS